MRVKDHPLYGAFCMMKTRCYCEHHKDYHLYGGRGITVQESWLKPLGFWTFVEEMGTRPEGFSIDRKNNNKGYSKENCRWASDIEQANNRRERTDSTLGIKHIYKTGSGFRVIIQKTKTQRLSSKTIPNLESAIELRNHILEEINS